MGLIMNDANAGHGEETSAPEAGSPKGEPAERDAFAVVEALNAENSQLKDRVLRTLAEMENLRRRTEREVADAKTYGVTGFARDMLSVVDNLARALEHLPAEARAHADPHIQSMIEGVELTARDLEAALGRHGVRKLEPKGQKFDPNFHQAIFEAPDETLPERLDDRRPGVASGDGRRLQGRAEGRAQGRARSRRQIGLSRPGSPASSSD
jgi:molecular chaperone GrpE